MATLIGPLTVHELAGIWSDTPAPALAVRAALPVEILCDRGLGDVGRVALGMRVAALETGAAQQLVEDLALFLQTSQELIPSDRPVYRVTLQAPGDPICLVLLGDGGLTLRLAPGGWLQVAIDPDATFGSALGAAVEVAGETSLIVIERFTAADRSAAAFAAGKVCIMHPESKDWVVVAPQTVEEFTEHVRTWEWLDRVGVG